MFLCAFDNQVCLGSFKGSRYLGSLLDFFHEFVIVAVDPDILDTAGEDVVECIKSCDSEPLLRNALDKNSGSRSSDAMVWSCEDRLPQADELPKRQVKVETDPTNHQDGKNQMRNKSIVFPWYAHVGPCERIQARHVVDIAHPVQRQEDGQNNKSHGDKDTEQKLQVLEEEVAIDTGNANELGVADCEDFLERLDCGHGGCNALCDRHKGGLVITGFFVSACWAKQGARRILDLVEQALSRHSAILLVVFELLGPCLV